MSTTNEYIININAEQATKNTKSLKQEIKELKDKLYELEEGTDDYNKVLDELSQKQFKVKEIQEQSTLATKDFGQYMTNGIKTISGGIGAIQSFTSAMSLLGVEIDDNNVLVEKLVASMALLQGLSALDDGIKAFTSLTKAIKTSTVATKALSTALNFLKAHPVLAILSAVTAVGGVIGSIVALTRDANKETVDLATSSQALNKTYEEIQNIDNNFEVQKLKASGKTEEEILKYKKAELQKLEKKAEQLLFDLDSKGGSDNEEITEQYKQVADTVIKKKEQLKQEEELLKIKKQASAEQERQKQAEDARQKALEKQIQLEEEARAKEEEWQSKLATAEDKKRARAEYDYLNGVITEIEYKERLLEIEETEIQNLTEMYELEGKNYHETQEFHDKRLQQIKDEIELNKLKEEQRVKELQDTAELMAKDAERYKSFGNYSADTDYQNQMLEALGKYKIDDTAPLKEQIEQARALEDALIQIEKEKQQKLYDIQLEGVNKQLELLTYKKENGLITEEEYQSGLIQLNAEKLAVQQEQANKAVEIEKQKGEDLKAVQELINQQQKELVGAISGLLGGIADNLNDDTEAYKHLKAAEAIINTLSASVATFSGITSSTGGWGIALAIAQASAVIATGMATVKQIYSVNTKGKNNGNYNLSSSASNALNKNYSNTRLTDGSGAEIDLGDSIGKSLSAVKVWVSASDITNTQQQMNRVEVNNQF